MTTMAMAPTGMKPLKLPLYWSMQLALYEPHSMVVAFVVDGVTLFLL
jgi:hypothetical protein